jgi:solute carrier family 35 protein C2
VRDSPRAPLHGSIWCPHRLKAGPCGVATGLDIGLSNLSLKTITLSFYSASPSTSMSILFA